MKARIKWVEDRTFIGDSEAARSCLERLLGPEGRSPGPSPMELVLIGMGGCSGYDVVHILEKGREAIEDIAVESLEAERAQQEPKVFTRIHMHFVVKGRRSAPERVERAIALSVEKYCSASAMIAKTATITHDFEVIDTTATGARGQ